MSELYQLIQRAQEKRDKAILRMLHRGWGPAQIGRKLMISRQRAQQIVRRLTNGAS